MNWWKTKKKQITLDCYTSRTDVYNYFPIVEAKKKIPEWFKKTPSMYSKNKNILDGVANIKTCPGLVDYYTKGFILPLWSDLNIVLEEKGKTGYRWQYSDQESMIDTHSPDQTNHYFPETKYQHLKLISPWFFVCNEDISFLAVEPGWQFDILENIRVLTGVLDFTCQFSTHVNLFCLRGNEERETILHSGTPIYHFIPLTDREIKLRLHLVSNQKMNSIRGASRHSSFFSTHKQHKKILQKSGCPFKFDVEE